jgi:hypothetical protein
MLDPVLLLKAIVASAVTAAVVLVLGSRPWRKPISPTAPVSSVLGLVLGFYVGCAVLGVDVHWPPREDQDRLLLVLIPTALLGELLAASTGPARYLSWVVRAVVVAGAAPILLYQSVYITDLSGSGSREWSPQQTWLILGGLAVALGLVWLAMCLLAERPGGRSVPLVVALTTAGVAGAVMLSGYASGGQLGLPLAGALVGVTIASLLLPTPASLSGMSAVGIVGLFALLVVGRFFGSLPTFPALVLFLAPLLCWLPEFPLRFRALTRLTMVGAPVCIALVLVMQNFIRESGLAEVSTKKAATPAEIAEPSVQDYLDFRK